MSNDAQQSRRQLVWGILIIAVGVLFLMDRNDLIELSQLRRYWPAILIAFGVSSMIPPTTGKHFLNGLWQVLVGAWFFICFEHVWGLTFRNSWPILVIIAGARMVLQPIVIKYIDKKEEL